MNIPIEVLRQWAAAFDMIGLLQRAEEVRKYIEEYEKKYPN